MFGPRYAHWMLSCLLSCGIAAAQSLAPQSGLLVLKNGQVLEGDITRAGDYYVVTRGEGYELRPKADDVECFCASLVEAYEFKARRLSGVSVRPRVELARWCLRYNLIDQCRDQLAEAELTDPGDSQVKELKSRLAILQETPATPIAPAATPTIPVEALENSLASLPRGSIERFGAIVQPILLNRCGANQCHGPNSKSQFKLLRPPPGQIVSRRFTQRNLYATLRQLNPSAPDQSPLVIKAEQRHGSSLTPVFDKHTANQFAELVAWARMTAAPSAAAPGARPASITPITSTLSQPAVSQPPAPAPSADGQSSATAVQAMRPALGPDSPAKSTASPGPRDRFDPEIFNRRYHR